MKDEERNYIMGKIIKEAFNGFGRELLRDIRKEANARISDATFEERNIGIEKTTISMLEANVNEKIIIKMLQKHWDLRLSEATAFLENCK